ncbi:hypothetical protein [Leptolyngbya iicbica]|uniref:Uncharacterized protein n=1 Tax=Lyngbya confervoides BDU141951 TaxID=1574623 RepID=A0A8T6QTU5_9CYAN|nr:hypothetical protein [Leptolyngbya sp. LK]
MERSIADVVAPQFLESLVVTLGDEQDEGVVPAKVLRDRLALSSTSCPRCSARGD